MFVFCIMCGCLFLNSFFSSCMLVLLLSLLQATSLMGYPFWKPARYNCLMIPVLHICFVSITQVGKNAADTLVEFAQCLHRRPPAQLGRRYTRAALTNGHTGHVPRAPGFFFFLRGNHFALCGYVN